jgi:putative ABC transport system permease protein
MPNLAKANLLARKTRSVITILGIAFSVTFIMVVVGMVNGTARDVVDRVLSIGADIMVGSSNTGVFYPTEIRPGKYQEVIADIEGVNKVAPVLIESASVFNGKKAFNFIYGIDFDGFTNLGKGFQFVEGRKLQEPGDLLVSMEMAELDGMKLNDTINFFNHDWKVVGIVLKSLGARFYVDRKELASITHPGTMDGDVATVFYVSRDEGVNVEELATKVGEEMGLDEWSVQNVKDLFATIMGSPIGLQSLMAAVMAVSAFICFVIIMLSMYNSIIERTSEIGILKSIGASRKFIITLIMKEASVVLILGILTGIVFSFIAQELVQRAFPVVRVELTLQSIINATIIATIATLLGTLYPAARASNLDPVEAMSWE